MYKEDLALNNLQWLICLKTLTNQPTNQSSIHLTEELKTNGTIKRPWFSQVFLFLLFSATLLNRSEIFLH